MKKYLAEQTVWRKRFLNPKWLPMTWTWRAHKWFTPSSVCLCLTLLKSHWILASDTVAVWTPSIVLMKGLEQMPRGHSTEPWLSMGSSSLGNCRHLWSNSEKLAPHVSGLETYWCRHLAGCISRAPLTSGIPTIWASDLLHPHALRVSNLTFLFCEN